MPGGHCVAFHRGRGALGIDYRAAIEPVREIDDRRFVHGHAPAAAGILHQKNAEAAVHRVPDGRGNAGFCPHSG